MTLGDQSATATVLVLAVFAALREGRRFATPLMIGLHSALLVGAVGSLCGQPAAFLAILVVALLGWIVG